MPSPSAPACGVALGGTTPAVVMTEYPVPTPALDGPSGIAPGADGNVWLVRQTRLGTQIGMITPDGVITEYPVPTPSSHPYQLALGPDGNIWFSENAANKIGHVTPSGVFTEYVMPTAASYPTYLSAGPDGNVWFVEAGREPDRPDHACWRHYRVPDSLSEQLAARNHRWG